MRVEPAVVHVEICALAAGKQLITGGQKLSGATAPRGCAKFYG
jgi:hypothetical protein